MITHILYSFFRIRASRAQILFVHETKGVLARVTRGCYVAAGSDVAKGCDRVAVGSGLRATRCEEEYAHHNHCEKNDAFFHVFTLQMSCSLTVCLRLLFLGNSCFSLALSVLYVLVRMYNNRILRLCQTKTAVFRQGSQKIHTFTRAIKEDTHARSPANNRSIYGTGNALAKGFAPAR